MALSTEQLEQRRHGLGSSDVPALCGENPYRGPHDVWQEKLGLVEPFAGNEATAFGSEVEPLIAKRYAKELGVELVPGPGTVAHPDHPWALCTTDYEHADRSRIVECKLVTGLSVNHWSDAADGAAPYYACQVQWQMFVRGIEHADIAVRFVSDYGGHSFRIYEMQRDELVIRSLFTIARDFWERCVEGQEPPAPDATEAAKNTYRLLYPRPTRPDLKPASAAAESQFYAYLQAREDERAAAEAAVFAQNSLIAEMADAPGLFGEFGSVTWKADKNGKRSFRANQRKERAA